FEKILRLKPDHSESLRLIKECSQKLKEQVEREQAEREERKKQQEQQRITVMKQYYATGVDLYQKGEYRSAIEEFEKILKLEPDHSESLRLIKECSQKLKEQVEREQAEREERKKQQEQQRITVMKQYYATGVDLYQKGEYQSAIEEFEKILRLKPDHSESLRLIEQCQQKIKEASEEYYTSGLKYYVTGEIKKAIEQWEKCLRLNPKHEKAKKALDKASQEVTQ
ncbi:MAG: tetratricopeptide repeat protein, partial [Elusimicrobiota bacterium]|nr:tetratricopeptide repeat protein [Elusimicrobiota bacterium]